MKEELRRHLEWPDYEVSNYGHIRRITKASGTSIGKILKGVPDKYGYLKVTLRNNSIGCQKVLMIHKLVLEVFAGVKNKSQTRHLDGNKTNNAIGNICWGTGVENYKDRLLHGTGNNGERCGTSKLTESDVLSIRARYKPRNVSLQFLADEFGVTNVCIRHVVNRKTWAHI